MTKRMLWYACLGLLCCLALTMVVQAAGSGRPGPVCCGNANPNPGAIANVPVAAPTTASAANESMSPLKAKALRLSSSNLPVRQWLPDPASAL